MCFLAFTTKNHDDQNDNLSHYVTIYPRFFLVGLVPFSFKRCSIRPPPHLQQSDVVREPVFHVDCQKTWEIFFKVTVGNVIPWEIYLDRSKWNIDMIFFPDL